MAPRQRHRSRSRSRSRFVDSRARNPQKVAVKSGRREKFRQCVRKYVSSAYSEAYRKHSQRKAKKVARGQAARWYKYCRDKVFSERGTSRACSRLSRGRKRGDSGRGRISSRSRRSNSRSRDCKN